LRVKNQIRAVWCLILLMIAVMGMPVMAAKDEFFPLDKIKPGLSGVGYTVFQGTKIESFNVKVIGLVPAGYGDNQLILVRLSGKRLEENGGLAAGMSGSPVYFKGKLAGAISFGFQNADPLLAMVTPIESMLRLLDWQRVAESRIYQSCHGIVPIATPVIVSGMGRRGYEMASRVLEAQYLKPVFSPGAAGRPEMSRTVPVKPGSAIAVQLVSGDYQVSAIGTVTWTGKNQFLAFGHPFMNKGTVGYNAYQAQVLQTVQSRVMSFKMGTALYPVGKIIQDRNAGIAGILGERQPMIEVEVAVRDRDRKLSRTSRFQVIDDELLYPGLIVSGITSAIDHALDRVGEGTAHVKVQLETLPGTEAIVRNNIFYSKDVAVSCLKDIADVLDMVAGNEFAKVQLKSIRVDVDIEKVQTTARVIKLETATKKVKPGDTVHIEAVLHSFRGETFKIPLQLTIPETSQSGKLLLAIHGGAENVLFEEKEGSRKKDPSKFDYGQIHSWEELVAEYLKKPTNNQLVLEYFPLTSEESEADEAEVEPERVTADTPYYILGEAQLILEVK